MVLDKESKRGKCQVQADIDADLIRTLEAKLTTLVFDKKGRGKKTVDYERKTRERDYGIEESIGAMEVNRATKIDSASDNIHENSYLLLPVR